MGVGRGAFAEELAGRLRYQGQTGDWHELPAWAGFLLRLGATIAVTGPEVPRWILAVSVPTRAYAASLLATGAVSRLAEQPTAANAAAHFAYLRGLPLGTTVSLVTGRTKKSAVLERFGANPDGDFVVLRETASRTHQLPARAALRIEASRHQRVGIPK